MIQRLTAPHELIPTHLFVDMVISVIENKFKEEKAWINNVDYESNDPFDEDETDEKAMLSRDWMMSGTPELFACGVLLNSDDFDSKESYNRFTKNMLKIGTIIEERYKQFGWKELIATRLDNVDQVKITLKYWK